MTYWCVCHGCDEETVTDAGGMIAFFFNHGYHAKRITRIAIPNLNQMEREVVDDAEKFLTETK